MNSTPNGGRLPIRARACLRRAVLVAASAGVAAVLVAGCGSSGSPSAHSAGPVTSPVASPTHAQRAIPADKDIVEVPALRRTITMTGCSSADGGWAGEGTAKNPGSAEHTYHILVFFNDKFSRTIDYARTSVTVAGGASGNWTATARFDAPAGTQCVLRGLYQT